MRKHPFTAIEMILVIAIASILLTIALPAFTRMAAGRQLTRAVSDIAAKISLARAKAVSMRSYVALIFPHIKGGEFEGISASDLSQDHALVNCSYRLAQVYKDSSGNFHFVKWLPDEDWEIFGEGVFIKDDADFAVESGTQTLPVVNSVSYDSLYSGETANADRAVIFSPTGKIVLDGTGNSKIQIRVVEGALLPPDFNTIQAKAETDGKKTYAVLSVSALSGRTEVSYVEEE